MANVLKDEKKQQILALGRLGWSLRKIQEATRVRRETIKRLPDGKTGIQVITGFGVELRGSSWENQRGVPSASACEPFREIIELGLTRDRNAMAIWQDLVSDHGFQGGYQCVRRSLTSCAERRYHKRAR